MHMVLIMAALRAFSELLGSCVRFVISDLHDVNIWERGVKVKSNGWEEVKGPLGWNNDQ